jgi:hypothetical protein
VVSISHCPQCRNFVSNPDRTVLDIALTLAMADLKAKFIDAERGRSVTSPFVALRNSNVISI